jgi:hypothetical protein
MVSGEYVHEGSAAVAIESFFSLNEGLQPVNNATSASDATAKDFPSGPEIIILPGLH